MSSYFRTVATQNKKESAMPFADKFNEAAQKAILRKIDSDQWEELPWLAKLIQKEVTISLTKQVYISAEPKPIDCSHMSHDEVEKLLGCEMVRKPAHPEHMRPADNGESFESNDFSHVDGYDWRIIVADRLKNHTNSWAEHFNRAPNQDEFEKQFRHFHARTHHVHVNQWVDGNWVTITSDYVPHWNKENPAETFAATSEWQEGKSWRIRFWDQRINDFNYVYFDYKPGGILLNKYHEAKCFAVTEKRPEGV